MTTLEAIRVPLVEKNGVLLVEGTRVPLDTVVHAFLNGESAEGIVESYTTLDLRDVYACIAYYLANREQVDAYLREQERAAEEVRKQVEARFPSDGLRARLLARRDKR